MTLSSHTTKTERIEEQNYDTVLYSNNAFPHSHPRNLYSVAKLFNLNPPDFNKCRVLELGCGCGRNILTQAQQYPECEFIGIDISAKQIKEANQSLSDLGFKNVTFIHEDITNIKDDLGFFDYIIAHGVLSWIPPEVQNKLFEIYKNHLSENGVGFVSYNTLPGWNAVRSISEAMKYHAQRFDSPHDKITQSKALLKFLSENVDHNDPYKKVIDNEIDKLKKSSDSYLFHEYLSSENHQFYFHDFIKSATEYDLQYIGDTILSSMYIGNMPETATKGLAALGGDIVMQEQYMDFIKNRRFRDSLITHSHLEIDRNIKSEKIFEFFVTANFAINHELSSGDNVVFQQVLHGASTISFDDPVMTELMISLSKHGAQPRHLKEVIKEVCKTDQDVENLHILILKSGMEMVLKGFIFLHSDQGKFVTTLSEKPLANPLARQQAASTDRNIIVNSFGENIGINKFILMILGYLDGTNDMQSLTDKMILHVKNGEFPSDQQGVSLDNPEKVAEMVKQVLQYLAKNAVLIA